MQHLNNIQIPDQSTFDDTTDAGLQKLQVVQGRLYNADNKIAHKDEFSAAEETDPVFTYASGNLSRIDYASGNYKLFTYDVSGNLTQLDFVKGGITYRKVMSYDLDFNLTDITFSTV